MEKTLDIEESSLHKKPITKTYTYEEAIAATGVGRFHYFLLLVSGALMVAAVVEVVGLCVIIFAASCDLQLSLSEKGILAACGYFGVVMSAHAMGFLSDTWGRVKLLKVSFALSILSSTISIFSVNFYMLTVLRFVTGFLGGCQLTLFTLLSEYHSNHSRKTHMSIFSSFIVVGFMYFEVAAILILPLDLVVSAWRIILLVFIIPTMCGVAGLLFIPESPKFLLAQGRTDEALEVLRRVYVINTGRPKESYPCDKVHFGDNSFALRNVDSLMETLKLVWSQSIQLFSKERLSQTLQMSCISVIITLIGGGLYAWMPQILNTLSNHQDSSICKGFEILNEIRSNQTTDTCSDSKYLKNVSQFQIYLYMSFAFLGFYIVNTVLINRVGRKPLLVFWFGTATICSIAVNWIDLYILNVIVLTLISQVIIWMGIILGIAADFYPTNINAMGVCLAVISSRLGGMIGSYVLGPSLLYNCDITFYIFGGGLAFVVLLIFLLK